MFDVIFFLLTLFAFIGFIIGLIKPDKVIKWGEKKTRKQVVLTYGIAILVFFILFVISIPPTEKKPLTEQQIEIKPEVIQQPQEEITEPPQEEVQKQPPIEKKVVFSSIVYEQGFIKELISYLDTKKDSETIRKLQNFYDLLGNLEPEVGFGLDMVFQSEGKIAKNIELSNELRQADPTLRRAVIITVLFPSYEAFYNDVEVINTCVKSAIAEKEKEKCIEKLPQL